MLLLRVASILTDRSDKDVYLLSLLFRDTVVRVELTNAFSCELLQLLQLNSTQLPKYHFTCLLNLYFGVVYCRLWH